MKLTNPLPRKKKVILRLAGRRFNTCSSPNSKTLITMQNVSSTNLFQISKLKKNQPTKKEIVEVLSLPTNEESIKSVTSIRKR